VLLAPVEVIGLVRRVDDFFAEWDLDRAADMPKRWSDLSDEIRLVAQRTVDEQRGRPYRAGEPRINAAPKPTRWKRLSGWFRRRSTA
jgi:hypothetical protein